MTQSNETDRRQHTRAGILESLGDITYAVLRKYGVTNPPPVAEITTAAALANS